MSLAPLGLVFSVLAVAAVVLVADLLMPVEEKRGIGALAALGLAGTLAFSFFAELDGTVRGAYVTDAAGLYLQRVLLLAGLLGALGSIDHVDRRYPARQGEHYLLMLLSLVGMLLLVGARDLLLWIVAFELAGLPLYALVGLQKDARGTEAALKLYLSGAASSAVSLYGFSLLWGMGGSTSLAALGAVQPQPLFAVGLLLVLAGASFKLGLVPFHLWMADTYQGAPGPTVAFLSVAPKVAAFGGLVRLFLDGMMPLRGLWGPAVAGLAILTMLVGNLGALLQRDARRLLALSGVGHMGLLLLALAAGTPRGLGALLFYTLAYTVANMGAFLVVSAVVDRTGEGSLDAFRGLARRRPALALALLVFLLSLGGIPFVAGFWAKLLLLWSVWVGGLRALVVLAAFLAVLSLFYYLRVLRALYVEQPGEAQAPSPGRATLVAVAVCAAGVVGIGLWPGPWFGAAIQAGRALLGG